MSHDPYPTLGNRVVELLNPVTGRWVKLIPAFEVPAGADRAAALKHLEQTFDAWCEAGWAFARLDPPEVDIRGMIDLPPARTITDMEILGMSIDSTGTTITRIRDQDTGDVLELRGAWYLGVPS